MPDLINKFLPGLQAGRLSGLDLEQELVFPAYGGSSILNLPASVCHWLNAPAFGGASPLAAEILDPIGNGFNKVILVLVDGLALHRFQSWLAKGDVPVWSRALENGASLFPLTSISPSTTSAALTSLWTGRSAAEHGILGYEMWLKEYSLVANTIQHSPMSFRWASGSLEKTGFTPQNFMTWPTLGAHLAVDGIKTYAFQQSGIVGSGLSNMFYQDVDVWGCGTPVEMWVNLRQLIETHPDERQYIWVYWDAFDHYSHHFGPDDERPAAEFRFFSAMLDELFLKPLEGQMAGDTLLIMTADHGHIHTDFDPHYELRNHPALTRMLPMQPSGENRLAYFYIRPGQTEAVREYLECTWPNQFGVFAADDLRQVGLLGNGALHPRLDERMGDYVVIAYGNAYLWWADKKNHLIGRHGGLSPDEMLVPCLAYRF